MAGAAGAWQVPEEELARTQTTTESEDGLEYIRIVVEPHPNPISYRGRFHYRNGSTKQVLEGAALTRLLLEKHGRTWDDVPLPGVALGDLESRAFTEFRRRGVEADRLPRSILQESDAAVIDRLQLREGAYLKRAAVLLFHPAPHRLVSEAYVKIGYFRGTEILYQDIVQGDLFTQIDRVHADSRPRRPDLDRERGPAAARLDRSVRSSHAVAAPQSSGCSRVLPRGHDRGVGARHPADHRVVSGRWEPAADLGGAAGRHPARAVSVLRGLPGGRPEGSGRRLGHYTRNYT